MTYNFGRNLFPPVTTQFLGTYNAVDVAQGIGYVNYYGGLLKVREAGAITSEYKLTSNRFYSEKISSSGAMTISTDFQLAFSGAFMLPFEQTQVMEGEALVNVPIGTFNGTETGEVYTQVSLLKEDETGALSYIVNRTSGAILETNPSRMTTTMSAIPFTVPITTFKKGQALQMNVELWNRSVAGGGQNVIGFIGHDPMNRRASGAQNWNSDQEDSNLIVQIPFKINQ